MQPAAGGRGRRAGGRGRNLELSRGTLRGHHGECGMDGAPGQSEHGAIPDMWRLPMEAAQEGDGRDLSAQDGAPP